MSGTTTNPCASALTFILLIGSMVLPALAREEIAVLTPGGSAVDISGERIAIGEPRANIGFIDSAGEVYIHARAGFGWRSETTLTASDIDEYDNFGRAVAMDGDVIAVGAPANDLQFPHLGAVYVFRPDRGEWVQEARLDSGTRGSSDNFGLVLDLEGNLLVVGNTSPGRVYVFRYEGGTWVEEAQLRGADVGASDAFGYSVSLSGDRVVVGSLNDDDAGENAGAAYVFRREGTTWIEEAKLIASDAAPDDRFGLSVAISGAQLVVGAPFQDDQGHNAGAVYAFERVGFAWEERGLLEHSDVEGLDEFGWAVAFDGNRVVVGALLHNPGTGVGGSGFLFHRFGDGWFPLDVLIPSGAAGGMYIGNSVALDGQLSALAGDFGSPGYVYDIGGDIPTVSEWGMFALTLLVLIAGTVLLRRTNYYQGEESHAPDY